MEGKQLRKIRKDSKIPQLISLVERELETERWIKQGKFIEKISKLYTSPSSITSLLIEARIVQRMKGEDGVPIPHPDTRPGF